MNMKKLIVGIAGIALFFNLSCGILKKGCNCPKAKTSSVKRPNLNV
jgi:hypothetical protein